MLQVQVICAYIGVVLGTFVVCIVVLGVVSLEGVKVGRRLYAKVGPGVGKGVGEARDFVGEKLIVAMDVGLNVGLIFGFKVGN